MKTWTVDYDSDLALVALSVVKEDVTSLQRMTLHLPRWEVDLLVSQLKAARDRIPPGDA